MNRRIETLLVSALIGAFYWWVWVHFWGMHVIDNPLNKWMLANQLPRHHHALYWLVIYSHDVIVNVLVAIPFAAVFVLTPRLNKWWCIAMAALAVNVASYWGTVWVNIAPMTKDWGFWVGIGLALFTLPAAFLIVRAIPGRWLRE